jgi:hypothetical protein
VRRHAALLAFALGALLLTPGAVAQLPVPGDPTPPVITPIIAGTLGSNGWYVTNVTVNWRVEDPESVILESNGCDARTLNADTAGTTLTCRARSDGGETQVSKTFKLDRTAPTAAANPNRSADANGWYNHSLQVSFSGSDAMSGLDSCSGPQTYAGPDSSGASASGSCKDHAGNTKGASLAFKYDGTAPQASAAAARAADSNGWYNRPLAVSFAGSDATSGIESCSAPQTYAGPDGAGSVSGSCRDVAANVATRSLTLAYDATPPAVSAAPTRTADANGWYNRPVTVLFRGVDHTSGVATCSAVPYGGPDDSSAVVSGTCQDRAGNAAAAPFAFKYDSTAPPVNRLHAKPGNRSTLLSWNVASGASVVVTRTPGVGGAASTVVYRGTAETYRDTGLRVAKTYRYTVTAEDQAANSSTRAIGIVATGPLLDPAPGERVKMATPPRLVWTAVKGARYYNVQLIRNGQVLSAWPRQPSFQIKRTWSSKGRRYRLRPGVYRWYVWPGFGRPAQGDYGDRIGGSSFVVVR